MTENDNEFETLAIHAGQPPDPATGAVMSWCRSTRPPHTDRSRWESTWGTNIPAQAIPLAEPSNNVCRPWREAFKGWHSHQGWPRSMPCLNDLGGAYSSPDDVVVRQHKNDRQEDAVTHNPQ